MNFRCSFEVGREAGRDRRKMIRPSSWTFSLAVEGWRAHFLIASGSSPCSLLKSIVDAKATYALNFGDHVFQGPTELVTWFPNAER